MCLYNQQLADVIVHNNPRLQQGKKVKGMNWKIIPLARF